MSSPYPTRLSELHTDPNTTTLYTTLKQLKKSTLSLHNRLNSILTDAAYISNTIHTTFPTLPLIANERCGSWYIPPALKHSSAYFKSTDGHVGQWAFSLRRLNLSVLDVLGRHGGAVLVDSTRRGKRMPDALRRTVPVWTVVWNRVLFGELRGVKGWEWAFGLQHPGLDGGEVSAVESRIEGWVEGLLGLGLDLGELKGRVRRPIRLCWVVQGEEMPGLERKGDDGGCELSRDEYNLFVLCSASRRVLGAEMSEDGYVQGAADDAEGWSGGLTSSVFWINQEALMEAQEEELPGLIPRLVEMERAAGMGEIDAVQIWPTPNVFIAAVNAKTSTSGAAQYDLTINCGAQLTSESPHTITLGCRSGKLGSRDLREKLPQAIARATETLHKNSDSKILIVCETGRDLSVGVAVSLLCLLFHDKGHFVSVQANRIDKQLVKQRLAWITSVKPDANPSRSTLQAVNSFLM